MNSNMGMAMVCMVDDSKPLNNSNLKNAESFNTSITTLSKDAVPKVKWSAEDQGWIFGAFNAGLLCMLLTGFLADKFNAKYMIIVSVLLASAANIIIPLTASYNKYLHTYCKN